ncbi:hypothetical protein DRO32_05630 [Candidatus Bathyarchaeota archaeon]|nr:MAG: hypothetical protein DRO32_05630 [Candidatus Bathyarchaeota archaeon]
MLPLRLREARSLVLLAACLLTSSGLEAAVVHFGFTSWGLRDTYVVWRLGLWSFFIPALVALALTFSWLHLIRSFLVAPRAARKATRRARRARAATWSDRLVRRIGVLGLATLKGLAVVLLGFSLAILVAMLTFYSPEAYVLSGSLLKAFPPFSWLITGISKLVEKVNTVEKLGKALDWLKEASIKVSDALSPLAEGLREAEPIYKYAFVQDLLAWSSGLSALLYRRPPVVRRRR